MTKRFLFNISNRRGLGHLMRGVNIAKAISRIYPDSRFLFVTRGSIPDSFGDPRMDFFAAPDLTSGDEYRKILASFGPDVVVFDTMLPTEDIRTQVLDQKIVYVMRKCDSDRQREIIESPMLREDADLIIVPHSRAEFEHELPAEILQKTTFAGTIVRLPELEVTERLRNRYEVRRDGFLLVSTLGGGGYADDAQFFIDTVSSVDRLMRKTVPHFQHIMFTGPKFCGHSSISDTEFTIVESEPDLVSLFPLCQLVISAAGYNTVNEIRSTKTPAVFLPGKRKYDDQTERVRALEQRGLAKVFTHGPTTEIAEQISKLSTETGLARMNANYGNDDVVIGNVTAAKRILSLVES